MSRPVAVEARDVPGYACDTCHEPLKAVVTAYGARALCGCVEVRWTRLWDAKASAWSEPWQPEKRQSLHNWRNL